MGISIAIVVVLVVVLLLVRGQSDVRLRKMRAELMAMRSYEQHLQIEKAEVQQLIDQVTESLKHATGRQETAQNACRDLRKLLEESGVFVAPVKLEMPEEDNQA
ncbi:MAG TPA: hypothetical protein EYG11_12025 [Candidatus Latescibacteria bacterium]|nr:hypothetical protein [Candidatus Handelsmanbacteria bacterium]HIL09421.1 hypothetical protein [Candidatus Latescibacterota bacterium]